MRALVAYASAHGSTRGIASAIGAELTATGIETDVCACDEVTDLDRYDAVVVGSAIHNMAWLPEAMAFANDHAAELHAKPVWCFSVSSVGATSSFFGPRVAGVMRRMHREPREMAEMFAVVGPREHRDFAGAVQPGDWGPAGACSSAPSAGSTAIGATGATSPPGPAGSRVGSMTGNPRRRRRRDA